MAAVDYVHHTVASIHRSRVLVCVSFSIFEARAFLLCFRLSLNHRCCVHCLKRATATQVICHMRIVRLAGRYARHATIHEGVGVVLSHPLDDPVHVILGQFASF